MKNLTSNTSNTKTEVRPVWVIKDSKGNITDGNSIKVIEGERLYITSKVFNECARAYTNVEAAEKALSKLKDIDETFHLENVDLNSLIKEAKGFVGESLVIRVLSKVQVA